MSQSGPSGFTGRRHDRHIDRNRIRGVSTRFSGLFHSVRAPRAFRVASIFLPLWFGDPSGFLISSGVVPVQLHAVQESQVARRAKVVRVRAILRHPPGQRPSDFTRLLPGFFATRILHNLAAACVRCLGGLAERLATLVPDHRSTLGASPVM